MSLDNSQNLSIAQCAFSVLLMPYTANLNSQFNSCFSSYILCKYQTEGPHYSCVSFITCNFKLIIIIIIIIIIITIIIIIVVIIITTI